MDFNKIIAARNGLDWLDKSVNATNGFGSSWGLNFLKWPGRRWQPAYPETTGYLINTWFNYADNLNDSKYATLAIQCGEWLVNIQNQNGSFNSLTVGHQKPSVFNTGMILKGLLDCTLRTQNEDFKNSTIRAFHWMMDVIDDDFRWKKHSYVLNFSPTYYSYFISILVKTNNLFGNQEFGVKIEKALLSLENDYNEDINQFQFWGFNKELPAFTHTIAYTLQGFLDTCKLLQKSSNNVDFVMQKLKSLYVEDQGWSSSYDRNWVGDKKSICVPGNFQLAILFYTYFDITQDKQYKQIAHETVDFTSHYQLKGKVFSSLKGAFPGSFPYYGKYLKCCFPNWAVKFYLDAILLQSKY